MRTSIACTLAVVVVVLAGNDAAFSQARKPEGGQTSPLGKNEPADDALRSIYPNLPPNQDPAAVARGKPVFEANCAFCHGADATGGNGGPDLLRSVLVNHDEKGNLMAPVIREGRVSKGMPAFNLTDVQVADLVAFLHQRNRDARLRFTYKLPNVAIGDANAGKAYFESHCAGCHSATGDLAGIASKYAADELQQRWLGPPPQPVQLTVTLPTGQSYAGRLEHLDEFSASLFDTQGSYHSFRLTPGMHIQVADPLAAHHKLLERLSDRNLHDVTTYLETLK
ncbi:MAG TPA: c-type cytochrome [Terriglobales bacterium]